MSTCLVSGGDLDTDDLIEEVREIRGEFRDHATGVIARIDERADRIESLFEIDRRVRALELAQARVEAERALRAEVERVHERQKEESAAHRVLELEKENAERRGSWKVVVAIGTGVVGLAGTIGAAIAWLLDFLQKHAPKGPNP